MGNSESISGKSMVDNSKRTLAQCLKQRAASQLIENTKMFNLFGSALMPSFAPAIEDNVTGVFVTNHPYNLLVAGEINDDPWINSYTRGDGSLPGMCKSLHALNKSNNFLINRVKYFSICYNIYF